MTTLFLVRHGQTDWNATARLQGATDIALNAAGLEQAQDVARALSRVVSNADTVVSSTLSRALDTATHIARALGVDVRPEPRVIERSYGIWEGTTLADRMRDHADQVMRWRQGSEPNIEGYESQQRLMERMSAAIAHATATSTGSTVIVSHGSAIRAGVLALTGIRSSPSQAHSVLAGLNNAHWAQLSNTHGSWSIDRYNVAPHCGSQE